jgi:hypothetical protein
MIFGITPCNNNNNNDHYMAHTIRRRRKKERKKNRKKLSGRGDDDVVGATQQQPADTYNKTSVQSKARAINYNPALLLQQPYTVVGSLSLYFLMMG